MSRPRPSYYGRLPGSHQVGTRIVGVWWTVTGTGFLILNAWCWHWLLKLHAQLERVNGARKW